MNNVQESGIPEENDENEYRGKTGRKKLQTIV
jgi:hypothetical protein